jgi:peptidyl-prolyl cis-trans isomerase D
MKSLVLTLTDKELQDMETGPFADPLIKQNFTDPATGVFNPAKVSEFLTQLGQLKGDEQINRRSQWREFEEAIIKGRLSSKYTDLISKGMYVPTFMVNNSMKEKSSTASISFTTLPYTMISDSSLKITDEEVKAFMKKKEALLLSQEAMANAEFVVFDITPTKEDTSLSLGFLNTIRAEFDSIPSDNLAEYVAKNSEETLTDLYLSEDKLQTPNAAEILAAPVGAVVGPYFANGAYKLARIMDKKSMPDSVKASHILVGVGENRTAEAAKLSIDSIETMIKSGMDFATLATSRSEDQGSATKGGDLGFFAQGMMVPEFNDACFNGKVGDLKVVKTQFGYHLIKVTEQKNFKPAVKLAVVSKALQASETTIQSVFAKAAEFASKAKDVKTFESTAKTMGKDKRVASNITKTQRSIQGLGSAREFSRWAFDSKIGAISGVMNLTDKCVIAHLVSRQEKGSLPAVETIKPQVEFILKREKKAEMLIAKAKGKTSLQEIALLGNSEVKNADTVLFAGGGNDIFGYEPKVTGAAFNKSLINKLSPGIPGEQGVYFITVKAINEAPAPQGANPMMDMERSQVQQQITSTVQQMMPQVLKKKAKIVDNRSNFF